MPYRRYCAEVVVAGKEGGTTSKMLFKSLGIGAGFKFLTNGLCIFPEELDVPFKEGRLLKGSSVGLDVYPSFLGAGFLVGPSTACYVLLVSVIGWFVITATIYFIGQYAPEAIGLADLPISS